MKLFWRKLKMLIINNGGLKQDMESGADCTSTLLPRYVVRRMKMKQIKALPAYTAKQYWQLANFLDYKLFITSFTAAPEIPGGLHFSQIGSTSLELKWMRPLKPDSEDLQSRIYVVRIGKRTNLETATSICRKTADESRFCRFVDI